MSAPLRRFVRHRARGRCEYCHLPDFAARAADFHLEHVIAKQHRGGDAPANRAWSCHRCNFRKGPNLSGIDEATGGIVTLFNPRRQRWKRHFRWEGAVLIGLTRSARATIATLDVNERSRVALRRLLMAEGEWPAD